MAKKDKKEVKEEVVEEPEEEEVEHKLESNTIIGKHGFTWKVDKDGQKIERV